MDKSAQHIFDVFGSWRAEGPESPARQHSSTNTLPSEKSIEQSFVTIGNRRYESP